MSTTRSATSITGDIRNLPSKLRMIDVSKLPPFQAHSTGDDPMIRNCGHETAPAMEPEPRQMSKNAKLDAPSDVGVYASVMRFLGFRFYPVLLQPGMPKNAGFSVVCTKCGKPIANEWGRKDFKHIYCAQRPSSAVPRATISRE